MNIQSINQNSNRQQNFKAGSLCLEGHNIPGHLIGPAKVVGGCIGGFADLIIESSVPIVNPQTRELIPNVLLRITTRTKETATILLSKLTALLNMAADPKNERAIDISKALHAPWCEKQILEIQ